MDRDLPDGVIDANPPGGWDEVGDDAAAEQNAAAQGSPDLTDAGADLAPDDPGFEERVQGSDPDLSADRGEEP